LYKGLPNGAVQAPRKRAALRVALSSATAC